MDFSTYAFFLVAGLVVLFVIVLRFIHPRSRSTMPGQAELDRAVPIGEVHGDGPVILVGDVVPGKESLAAPLSGRRCVAWSVEVDEFIMTTEDVLERDARQRRNGAWRTILHEQQAVELEIEDSTGRALVRAEYPELTLAGDSGWESWALGEVPAEVIAFLRDHGQFVTNRHGMNRRLRAWEGVLEVGERVVVAGDARHELDSEAAQRAGYRQTATRVVVVKPKDETLVISDDFDAVRRHGLRRFS